MPSTEPASFSYGVVDNNYAEAYASIRVYAPKSLVAPPIEPDDTLVLRDAFSQAFDDELFADFTVVAGSETFKVRCGKRGALPNCRAA